MGERQSMVVHIKGNIDALRKSMADGTAVIEGTSVKMRELAKPTDTLHQSFSKFDSVLASVGINIGTEVRALGELSVASGQTAGALGTLTTAGLAAGAAFAGWNIGRRVSEFFDLDDAIGRVTAKMLGWGDVAAQEAAAGADTLAKASKLAGMEITNMEAAVALLSGAAKANADIVAETAARNAKTTQDKSAAIIESNRREMEALKAASEMQKEAAEQAARMAEATDHLKLAQGDYSSVLAQFDQQLVANIRNYVELGLSVRDISVLLGESETKVGRVTEALDAQSATLKKVSSDWDAMAEANRQANEASVAQTLAAAEAMRAAFKKASDDIIKNQQRMSPGGSMTYDLSTPEGMARFRRLNPSAHIGNIPEGYFDTHTLQDAIEDGLIDLYAGFRNRGFVSGVRNFEGGPAIVGERGPELVTLPRGAIVFPNHELGGMKIEVHVHGSMFSTEQQVADAVGRAIDSRLRGSMRRSVGA